MLKQRINLSFIFILIIIVPQSIYGDIWQVWGDLAVDYCNTKGKNLIDNASSPSEKSKVIDKVQALCDNVQEIVEECLSDLASKMSIALGKQREFFYPELVENSNLPVFKKRGKEVIKDTVDWVLDNQVSKSQEIGNRFKLNFAQWFLDLAVKNQKEPELKDVEQHDYYINKKKQQHHNNNNNNNNNNKKKDEL